MSADAEPWLLRKKDCVSFCIASNKPGLSNKKLFRRQKLGFGITGSSLHSIITGAWSESIRDPITGRIILSLISSEANTKWHRNGRLMENQPYANVITWSKEH